MKTRSILLALSFLFFFIAHSTAQDSGDHIFDHTILHEIKIEFTQDGFWDSLTNNYENNINFSNPIPYMMGKVTIDGEEVDSVGVRLKGFTSYTFAGDSDKKPIKIDFNEFVSGKRYDGLRKLNLNNSLGDPSMQREVVCYDLLRSMGVDAPRTSYSKVFINDEYWGLYLTVEQVDKEFLQNNFSNDDGNLFKNGGFSHFEWLGNSVEPYDSIFDLKTNKDENDWSGFINLMDVLNNTADADFKESIEEVFNVELYLKTLAVDVATNNWDSYLRHGRNWYVYEDTDTDIFHWIPWDYNLALSGDLNSNQITGCQIFPGFIPVPNGTTTINFYDDSFANGVLAYEWDFGDGNTSIAENPLHTFSEEGTYNVCLTIKQGEDCEEQKCEMINTADDLKDCISIMNGTCPHPAERTFATVLDFFPSCCDLWDESCENAYEAFSGVIEQGIGFSIDQRDNEYVLINRLLNVPEFYDAYLESFCNLMNNHFTTEKYYPLIDQNRLLIEDAVESDSNLLVPFQLFQDDIGSIGGIKTLMENRIEEINMELSSLISCPAAPVAIPLQDVVINELVASNDSTSLIMDADGEFDDWVEFYNNTSTDVDLSNVYCSDAVSDLFKWKFPQGTIIPANGYLILWADNDEGQNGLHSNFKLSKDGEQLFLSNIDGSLIDSVTFGLQTTNIAFARNPNGTGNFVVQSSTFNGNNEDATSTFDYSNAFHVEIYPVPASEYLQIIIKDETNDFSINVFDVTGKQILKNISTSSRQLQLDLNGWKNGFYFLNIRDGEGKQTSVKFVKLD